VDNAKIMEEGHRGEDISALLADLHGEGLSILMAETTEAGLLPPARLIRIAQGRIEESTSPIASGAR
jgi:hypothetical protein